MRADRSPQVIALLLGAANAHGDGLLRARSEADLRHRHSRPLRARSEADLRHRHSRSEHASGYDLLYARTMIAHGKSPRRHLAAATSGGGCTLEDDDATLAAFGALYGLNSCADVAAANYCNKDLAPLCPVTCGACSDPAALAPTFCGCFQAGWSANSFSPSHCWMTAGTILPFIKGMCNATWYEPPDQLPGDPSAWTAGQVLSWSLMGGDMIGLDSARFFASFLANRPIDGKHFTQISSTEGLAMGLNVGEAFQLSKQLYHYFFVSYHSPPYDTYAIWDESHNKDPQVNQQGEFERVKTGQNPIEVSMTVVLESLIGVDEVNFFFEVQSS